MSLESTGWTKKPRPLCLTADIFKTCGLIHMIFLAHFNNVLF